MVEVENFLLEMSQMLKSWVLSKKCDMSLL